MADNSSTYSGTAGGHRGSRNPRRAGQGSAPAPGSASGASSLPTPSGGSGTGTSSGSRPAVWPGAAGASPLPVPGPGDRAHERASRLLMDREQAQRLRESLRLAALFVNSRHLEMLAPAAGRSLYRSEVQKPAGSILDRKGIAVFHVSRLMLNEEEDSFEKLVSLYSAIYSFGGIAAMILQSDGKSLNLYLCTNTSGSGEVAGSILAGNLRGQFPGCRIEELSAEQKDKLLGSIDLPSAPSRTVRSLSMIPSRREDEAQKGRALSAQGMEKFADAMTGRKYTLVILAQPVSPDAMDQCREGLEQIFTSVSPFAKEQVSYGESETDSVSYTMATGVTSSVSRSISQSFGTSHTRSISQGRSTNSGSGYDFFGVHFNSGKGHSSSSSDSDTSSTGGGTSRSDSSSSSNNESDTMSSSTASTRTITMSRDNKSVTDLLMKVEEHIKRINLSQTFGMWNCACYVIADDAATAVMATSTLASLYAGDSQAAPRAYFNQWDASCPAEREKVLTYLSVLQHPLVGLTICREETAPDGTSRLVPGPVQVVTPAMMISGRELPTIMSFPRKSVSGVTVDRMAEFGRNIPDAWRARVKRPVPFGRIYHMGEPDQSRTILDLDSFASHVFICGASGSGKSNTTYNLLQELIARSIPFLVIEPAKGEYKTEFGGLKGIQIFTADASPWRQLRINPFEFGPGTHIREHLDSLVQTVSACWPLYGAMPGILKQAFEQVYVDHGWDLVHSERIAVRGSKFPVFKDLIDTLNAIIAKMPYSAQTKGDYRGALVNRVSSLCNGFEGQIFGHSMGVPEAVLFGRSTVIDLSAIGSDETRSLIMGILIIRLREYRKQQQTAPNSALRHVTVLEEAHNLLKRCSQETGTETGNVQGAAVAGLCRCIAEMRTYGEGFMIIDQSPGAVDEAAIRNTAIKIVMRLPARTDCEDMGAALSLDETQMRELSRLDTGVAAIFHAGWTDTVLAKMGEIWDGRYRLTRTPQLSRLVYGRTAGALIQLMFERISGRNTNNLFAEAEDLLEDLRDAMPPSYPALPADKEQELLEAVQVFLEENDTLLKERNEKELLVRFLDFTLDLLGLSAIMRIFTPERGNEELDGFENMDRRQKTAAVSWEKQVRAGVEKYLVMPLECDPAGAYRWPVEPCKAQHFDRLYPLLLMRYAQAYTDGFGITNAVLFLRESGWFTKMAGR